MIHKTYIAAIPLLFVILWLGLAPSREDVNGVTVLSRYLSQMNHEQRAVMLDMAMDIMNASKFIDWNRTRNSYNIAVLRSMSVTDESSNLNEESKNNDQNKIIQPKPRSKKLRGITNHNDAKRYLHYQYGGYRGRRPNYYNNNGRSNNYYWNGWGNTSNRIGGATVININRQGGNTGNTGSNAEANNAGSNTGTDGSNTNTGEDTGVEGEGRDDNGDGTTVIVKETGGYAYSEGKCPDKGSTGLACAPKNLAATCDKYGENQYISSFTQCLELCKPSFCCIHDAKDNTKAPSCSSDENCAGYAYCYIVWWKLHDTIGPALYLQLNQNDDFFDGDNSQLAGLLNPNDPFAGQFLWHHFDGMDWEEAGKKQVDGQTVFDAKRVFDNPDMWPDAKIGGTSAAPLGFP